MVNSTVFTPFVRELVNTRDMDTILKGTGLKLVKKETLKASLLCLYAARVLVKAKFQGNLLPKPLVCTLLKFFDEGNFLRIQEIHKLVSLVTSNHKFRSQNELLSVMMPFPYVQKK